MSASGMMSKSNGMAKKGVIDHINWTYFGTAGRGDPCCQMFEYHGQPHTKTEM